MVLTQTHCYQLLGLADSAPLSEVKRAYRRLARTMHPDAGGDHARFAEITAAYNVLTGRITPDRAGKKAQGPARAADDFDRDAAFADFRRRAATFRSKAEARGPERVEPRSAPPPGAESAATEGRSPMDDRAGVEASVAASTADLREATVSPEVPVQPGFWARLRTRLRRARAVTGSNIEQALAVDVETLLRGAEPTISVTRLAACPSCGGQGDGSCICRGEGRLLVREKVKVVVPPGARPGARLRLRSKGNEGLAGEPAGDLYLTLEPVEVPGYLREGADLRGTLEVPASLARHGGALAIPTPWGSVRLDVPPGTRDGMRFRLPGQGLPRWRSAGRGELFLLVAIR
jgi:molecular chaperone DnaJ